jgi:insulin gene enhancer protein ISL-1
MFTKNIDRSIKDGRKMNYGAMQGIPMVASSPIRHESPLNMHGHEVSTMSYQPPWKALSDFALHADLEGSNGPVSHSPAFQHLMNQVSRRVDVR